MLKWIGYITALALFGIFVGIASADARHGTTSPDKDSPYYRSYCESGKSADSVALQIMAKISNTSIVGVIPEDKAEAFIQEFHKHKMIAPIEMNRAGLHYIVIMTKSDATTALAIWGVTDETHVKGNEPCYAGQMTLQKDIMNKIFGLMGIRLDVGSEPGGSST